MLEWNTLLLIDSGADSDVSFLVQAFLGGKPGNTFGAVPEDTCPHWTGFGIIF